MESRSVVTLAFGKEYYLGLASSLARSFRLWNPDGAIAFTIVTDLKASLPADLEWVDLRRVDTGTYDSGFGSKLHLDEFGNTDANLFIDADCLVFGPLDSIFESWANLPFAVVGEMVSQGEFFGDVAARCSRFRVPSVPRLVGSLYYWRKDGLASKLFASAREIVGHYDEWGFVRLRGMPNEEPVISVAFAQLGLAAQGDDGTMKADAMAFRSIERCDVTKGRPLLTNRSAEKAGFPTWLELRAAEPLVLHFNDSYAQKPPYLREASRLRLMARLPAVIAGPMSWILTTFPYGLSKALKDAFRPFYTRLYGKRPVKSSPRI
jgi:hypothetical protein